MNLEIRSAEGGEDSKLFVSDLAQAYLRMIPGSWISKDSPGIIILSIPDTYKNLKNLYKECGGHRVQRVPPTERKGRVHTSTVTVALIENHEIEVEISDGDIRTEWFSGSGAGGQHRNKTQNSCRMYHIHTGILVTAQTRKRSTSSSQARSALVARVRERMAESSGTALSAKRRNQVGSGMRGDKIRTYRFHDGTVTDHRSGKSAPVKTVMKGKFDLLW